MRIICGKLKDKRITALFILPILVVCILLTGCDAGTNDSYDGPPESKDSEPLNGTFTGDFGTLIFNGDGKTVSADFSDRASEYLPDGDYEYSFHWYSYGSCSYDVATECNLYDGENSYDFDCLGTSGDAVILEYLVSIDDSVMPPKSDIISMTFEKKE